MPPSSLLYGLTADLFARAIVHALNTHRSFTHHGSRIHAAIVDLDGTTFWVVFSQGWAYRQPPSWLLAAAHHWLKAEGHNFAADLSDREVTTRIRQCYEAWQSDTQSGQRTAPVVALGMEIAECANEKLYIPPNTPALALGYAGALLNNHLVNQHRPAILTGNFRLPLMAFQAAQRGFTLQVTAGQRHYVYQRGRNDRVLAYHA